MRPCIRLPIFAILLTASANAFPSPLSSSRAMPNNAVGVQGRRQLTSKQTGAGSDLVQQKAFGLRGGAVESVAAASSSTSLSAGMSLVEACGLAAPIASIFVSLSPFPTIQKILKDKSVGDLPLLPYSSLVANWYVMRKGQVECRLLPPSFFIYYYSHFAFESLKSHYYPGKASFG